MDDSLSLVSHTKEVDTELFDILFESDNLETRVGPVAKSKIGQPLIDLIRHLPSLLTP